MALFVSGLFVAAVGPAEAGQVHEVAGVLACVADKWEEKELEKGHKLADWVGRCVAVPDNPADAKYTEDCKLKYEYMPDGSFKAAGTCVYNYPDGDKLFDSLEEGSHLKESKYTITGGTGKYEGASGGGTYLCDNLTDSLCGGRYKGKVITK